MAIYIEDAEAEALASELARIRGISIEEAVRVSVLHALQELEEAEAAREGRKHLTRTPSARDESGE